MGTTLPDLPRAGGRKRKSKISKRQKTIKPGLEKNKRGGTVRLIRAYLAENPGATLDKIADGIGVARTTASSNLAKMARNNEVRTEPLPLPNRSKLYFLRD